MRTMLEKSIESRKINLEEIREAFKDIEESQVDRFILIYTDFLANIGGFFKEIGLVQQKSPKLYILLLEISKNPNLLIDFAVEMMEKIPKTKKSIKLVLRVLFLLPQISRFDELNSEEQIELGEELQNISTELKEHLSKGE